MKRERGNRMQGGGGNGLPPTSLSLWAVYIARLLSWPLYVGGTGLDMTSPWQLK